MKRVSNYYKLFFFVLCLIITACNNTNSHNSTKVKSTIDKELKGIENPLSGSSCPMDIQIVDSLIIIRDKCDEFFYHVYNKNTLKLVGKFGRKGKGPSEYLFPSMTTQSIKKGDSSYIYIYDTSVNRIDAINILEAVNRVNYYPKTLKINKKDIREFAPLYSAVIVADSLIIGSTQNHLNKGRFFQYEITNGKISYQPYYPQVKITPHRLMLSHLYACKMALKPDGENIAVVSRYLKRIDILDKKGQYKRSIDFETLDEEPDFSSAQRIPPLKSHFYFDNVAVSKKFIYTVDIDKKPIDNVTNMEPTRDYIFLYKIDWEGNYIEGIKLTPRVLHIAVDEQNHKIYGVNEAYEKNSLFVYNMN